MKTSQNSENKSNNIFKLVGGVLVGLINGFFGGGGGMIAVPLMTYLLKEEEKKAHATAIFIILPLSIASSIFYITDGVVEWSTLLNVSIGVLIGGIAGAIILNKIGDGIIKFIFAIVMIIAGVKMIF